MQKLPEKLKTKLEDRISENCLRKLPMVNTLIDFSSNDYLGFAKNGTIYSNTFQLLLNKDIFQNGATGSRLLTGNHKLYLELEDYLTKYHSIESALIFNSGYDANLGFFSCVPQRGDLVFYDEFVHASIRDGIKMGNAKSYKFRHNDVEDLQQVTERTVKASEDVFEGTMPEIYVVTESVFSMDGDSPDIQKLASFCKKYKYRLIIDEAHAIGVMGKSGNGLVQEMGIEGAVFARTITFGKALGSHGAAILGSYGIKEYLVNFARPLVYSTALSPHTIATVLSAYQFLEINEGQKQRILLQENIKHFKDRIGALKMTGHFIESDSAIQSCIVAGNQKVKSVANKLYDEGFDVKPILSPTVPEGEERLRFCIHSFNGKEEIGLVLQLLSSYI